MRSADVHELTALISDLAVVTERLSQPSSVGDAGDASPPLRDALAAFDARWSFGTPAQRQALSGRGDTLAAAGMALLEGDAVTAGRLIRASGTAR